jgi:hypothetical protein
MSEPELKFIGPEYDGAEIMPESLPHIIGRIMNRLLIEKYGEEEAQELTNVEVAPIAIEGDEFLVIRAWNKAVAPDGSEATHQDVDGVFDVAVDNINGYLHHRIEDGRNFVLSTAETVALIGVGKLALEHAKISSRIDQEAV